MYYISHIIHVLYSATRRSKPLMKLCHYSIANSSSLPTLILIVITLQDIFMWIINLGIEIMGERKYGDFFQKSPNFVPQIK